MSGLARTVLIGAGAGLLASYAMEQAQAALQRWHEAGGDTPPSTNDAPATEQAADLASELVIGAPIPKPQQASAGRVTHYVTGAGLGVLYAVGASRYRGMTSGFGLLYALAVSLLLDEGLVPALKLSPAPAAVPLTSHMDGLAAHAVFGLTLEAARATFDTLTPAHRAA